MFIFLWISFQTLFCRARVNGYGTRIFVELVPRTRKYCTPPFAVPHAQNSTTMAVRLLTLALALLWSGSSAFCPSSLSKCVMGTVACARNGSCMLAHSHSEMHPQ